MQFATQRMALSPISKPYFDQIDCVKVPALWSTILNPYQLQHALAGATEKWVNRVWSRSEEHNFPPELNQKFDTSLLTPPELIPDGSGSAIAVISYVTRILQLMICESDMFKDNLMLRPTQLSSEICAARTPCRRVCKFNCMVQTLQSCL